FMEEVVGFLFNIEVTLPETPEVGLAQANGKPVSITKSGSSDESATAAGAGAGTGSGANGRVAGKATATKTKAAASRRAPGKKSASTLRYTSAEADGDPDAEKKGQQTVVKSKDDWANTPRNAPCPCGSGKKYKMCHGRA